MCTETHESRGQPTKGKIWIRGWTKYPLHLRADSDLLFWDSLLANLCFYGDSASLFSLCVHLSTPEPSLSLPHISFLSPMHLAVALSDTEMHPCVAAWGMNAARNTNQPQNLYDGTRSAETLSRSGLAERGITSLLHWMQGWSKITEVVQEQYVIFKLLPSMVCSYAF